MISAQALWGKLYATLLYNLDDSANRWPWNCDLILRFPHIFH